MFLFFSLLFLICFSVFSCLCCGGRGGGGVLVVVVVVGIVLLFCCFVVLVFYCLAVLFLVTGRPAASESIPPL